MGKFESIGTIHPFLKLHEGEWADVYKAYDTALGRNVLLKKLKSILEHDTEIAERFAAEARLMAQIQHPNVVSVLTPGRAGSTVYFTAEFIEGQSLSDLLTHGPLSPLLAVHVLNEITKGLAAAHSKRIFHRDLKPGNVLVSDSGEVKLTDFGMASILNENEDTELRGTIGYIAPELLFDGEPGEASDIFSLGCTFYEMLTGTTAFRGESSSEVFDNTLNYDPIPLLESNPNIAPAIIHACRTALEKDPLQRYQNTDDLRSELDAILGVANTFDGRQEVVTYVENPESYEPSPAEETISKIPSVNPPVLIPSAVRMRSLSRRKRVAMGAIIVLLSLVVVYGLVEMPAEHSGIQEVTALTESPDMPEPDATVSDSGVMSPSLNAEIPLTQSDRSTPLIDSARLDGSVGIVDPGRLGDAEEEIGQVAVSPADTLMNTAQSREALPLPDLVESPSSGELAVLCTPFCTVYVNDDSIGVAPPGLNMVLPGGVHRLDLLHPILPGYSTDIEIEPGIKDSIKVALRDYAGTAELTVAPWAKVYIDDVFKGDVPPTKSFVLKPGEYILRLEHDLGTWTDTLLVVARERKTYKYNLSDLLR